MKKAFIGIGAVLALLFLAWFLPWLSYLPMDLNETLATEQWTEVLSAEQCNMERSEDLKLTIDQVRDALEGTQFKRRQPTGSHILGVGSKYVWIRFRTMEGGKFSLYVADDGTVTFQNMDDLADVSQFFLVNDPLTPYRQLVEAGTQP